MTRDEQAFIAAIRAAPADDVPRLVYADWLEEHDRGDRAELIRVGCEVEARDRRLAKDGRPVGDRDRRVEALRDRERWLLQNDSVRREALGPAFHGWLTPATRGRATFRRGFVEELTLSAADWLAHGDAITQSHPVRAVRLTSRPGHSDEFTIGGLPPGVSWYDVAGQRVEAPTGCGPAELFRLRWPGVEFELPPEERRGMVFTPPPDFLTRDYTREGLENMREAGRRRAQEREERFLRAFLGDEPEL